MDDVKRALLGDREAAQRLTDAGVLLSMTKEEAIATLEESKRQNKIMIDNPTTFWTSHQMADGVKNAERRIAALDMALSALRPVSREQVERIRGTWEPFGGKYLTRKKCSRCGWDGQEHIKFYSWCPNCGSPMTDEAVQMVMDRMEGLHEI